MTPFFTLRQSLLVVLGTLLAVAGPACGSGSDTLPTNTGGVGGATTSSGSGGGASSSSSSASSSSGAGGGASGCKTATDCKDPKKAACDVKTGDCVACLPAMDTCPKGEVCDPTNACVAGCKGPADCNAPTVCDAKTHQCVGCVGDGDCNPGAVCTGSACVPGCNAMHACAGTDTCCTASCKDLDADVTSCGACDKACPLPANGTATCTTGMCGITCDAAWADCNLDPADGCEQNTLQDGPCLCAPGATQPCYDGAPGTMGVGVCVGGTQTCDASGTSWGACAGEVIPSQQLCLGKDENCDGVPQPAGCSPCVPGVGVCNGNVGTYCPDGLGNVVENCDPLEGMTCVAGQCQGVCSKASLGTSSNVGCDFYPTVTANLVDPSFHFAVAVSNTSASTASVTIFKGAAQVGATAMIPANSVQVINLAWEAPLKAGTTPAAASVRRQCGRLSPSLDPAGRRLPVQCARVSAERRLLITPMTRRSCSRRRRGRASISSPRATPGPTWVCPATFTRGSTRSPRRKTAPW